MAELTVVNQKNFSKQIFGYNKMEVNLYLEDLNKKFKQFKDDAELLKEYNQQLEKKVQDVLLKNRDLEQNQNFAGSSWQKSFEEADARAKQLQNQVTLLSNENTALHTEVERLKLELSVLKNSSQAGPSSQDASSSEVPDFSSVSSITETKPQNKAQEAKGYVSFSDYEDKGKESSPKKSFADDFLSASSFVNDDEEKSDAPFSTSFAGKIDPLDQTNTFSDRPSNLNFGDGTPFGDITNESEPKKFNLDIDFGSASATAPTKEEPKQEEPGDEIYTGDVEEKLDESVLIGNDDDAEEGFSFMFDDNSTASDIFTETPAQEPKSSVQEPITDSVATEPVESSRPDPAPQPQEQAKQMEGSTPLSDMFGDRPRRQTRPVEQAVEQPKKAVPEEPVQPTGSTPLSDMFGDRPRRQQTGTNAGGSTPLSDMFGDRRRPQSTPKNDMFGADVKITPSEEIYSGEVQERIRETTLIGNDDDEDDDFEFL